VKLGHGIGAKPLRGLQSQCPTHPMDRHTKPLKSNGLPCSNFLRFIRLSNFGQTVASLTCPVGERQNPINEEYPDQSTHACAASGRLAHTRRLSVSVYWRTHLTIGSGAPLRWIGADGALSKNISLIVSFDTPMVRSDSHIRIS
jgi:hypothetical protein